LGHHRLFQLLELFGTEPCGPDVNHFATKQGFGASHLASWLHCFARREGPRPIHLLYKPYDRIPVDYLSDSLAILGM
jgi:hypothetical protein